MDASKQWLWCLVDASKASSHDSSYAWSLLTAGVGAVVPGEAAAVVGARVAAPAPTIAAASGTGALPLDVAWLGVGLKGNSKPSEHGWHTSCSQFVLVYFPSACIIVVLQRGPHIKHVMMLFCFVY